jgi:hypothetical protein
MGQKGPSQSTQDTQQQLTKEQIQLAQQQDARSQQLFNLTEPGLQLTESFYKKLASGDPTQIQQATAPATEQIASNVEQSKKAISAEMPRGGARDVALQEADITKSAEIGNTKAQAYLGSFPALASLAGTGIGLSINEVTQALSAFQGASSSNQAAGQMEGAGKAQTLGFLGSLGNSAATGAGMALGCWIAEAIFGPTNLRTVRLRVYLNDVWAKQSAIGLQVMFLYRIFGRQIARQVEKRSWVRKLFTPLFLYADRCAYRWEFEQVKKFRDAGVI